MFYYLKEIRMVSYEARRIKKTCKRNQNLLDTFSIFVHLHIIIVLLSYYCFVCLSIENKPCLRFISGVSCVDIQCRYVRRIDCRHLDIFIYKAPSIYVHILCKGKDEKINLLHTAAEAGGAESWFPVCNDYLGCSSEHRYLGRDAGNCCQYCDHLER